MATVTAVLVIVMVQNLVTGHHVNWRATSEPFLYLLPGWALVMSSRRWPRVTGALLAGVVAWQVRQVVVGNDAFELQVAFFWTLFVVLPFLVPSIALLTSRKSA